MATLNEYRDEQRQKLERLRQLGVNPYPADSNRTGAIAELLADPDGNQGKEATIAGRLLEDRNHGKLIFLDVADAAARLQVVVRDGDIAPDYPKSALGFADLGLLGRGDIIEVTGVLGTTKTGQVSLMAKQLRILTKALRPLPDELKDKETRLRRRYLDLVLNPEVRERFARRAQFWQVNRQFLIDRGFLEINTPVLEHTTGGAEAKPFATHMDALDEEFYLRISHELPLKRLIGGGYERVFDIGPRFRNENYSDEHLPEHVAMEFYWAYADWKAGQKLVQQLLQEIASQVYGKTTFSIRGHEVDLAGDWEEVDFAEIMQRHYGFDVFDVDLATVQAKLHERKLESSKEDNLVRVIDKLWKDIRKDIAGPIFLINHPKFLSPLAKSQPADPRKVERLQVILAGTEIANGWSELNDPEDQLARFQEQQQLRDAGDSEAQMLDIDYVEMLEYGMPPTFGYGHSERLFWLLEDVSAREGVPFPQLRREIDSVTRSIYPDLFK